MYKFTPVQIIADYILRFLKNNADAKLYEAMQRLETKIGQFIADGVDEHQLRSSLREGANKRGNSSRLTQSFHFFMFEPIFSPVNALNQPI